MRDVSGAPIAGAQVLIVGSAYASTTNEQGYYFINNVPAGVITVRAQYIGYAPAEARGVRVLAGQTMTVPLQLTPQTVQVEGITVEVVANPIVPRDQVASKPIVSGDVVQSLPVSSVTDAIRLQPGVVQSARGLSIRGGRIGEAVTYVDGVPIRSVSGLTSTATGIGTNLVGTDALEEASITTGAIGATQGDAQAGVISLVTRSGGQRFTPFLRLESDEFGGQKFGQGLNRLEASLGGPLARNLTYFLSTTMEGRQSPLAGKGTENAPLYVLNGIDTTVFVETGAGDSARVDLPAFTRYSTGMRVPDAWQNDWNIDTKVTYSYGTGSRISLGYHRVRNQGLNFRGSAPGNWIYDPQSQTGFLNKTNALILNWSQTLSRSSEHALSLDAAFSLQSDRTLRGLVDQNWFSGAHNPTGGFEFSDVPFVVNFDNFTLDDRLIQNIRTNTCGFGRDASRPNMGGCTPYYGRVGDFVTSPTYRANPYGAPAGNYPNTGARDAGANLYSENRTTGRVTLDWQANRYNRVQVGGDFLRADVKTWLGNLTRQIFMDAAMYKPNRMGMYAQDRLDLGDVVIDMGLRYDRLNSNVLFPRVAGEIFSDPLRGGTSGLAKLTGYGLTPTALDSQVANRCQAAIAAADTTAWSTCNLFPARAHDVLQPSVRVSFPVTDRTGFRLSYAQQAQTPDFQYYAQSVNTDLSITNTNSFWGQDIGYGKSILFEFGVRHAFSEDMVLDISAYNKDKVSDVAGRVLDYFNTAKGAPQAIDLFTNQDFGNVRGVDVKLDRRVGSLFQGSLAYTYQTAKSTGSDPTEYLNTYARSISNTGQRFAPPQVALTTRDNRTHTIAGSLVLNLPQGWHQGTTMGTLFQGFGAFATFRFASGLAYTPFYRGANGCENTGAGTIGPGNNFGLSAIPCAALNSRTTPWIKNVDLRLTRAFGLSGSRTVTVFADFRNLFNFTNISNLFVETGDIHNAEYQKKQVGTSSAAWLNFTSEFGDPSTTALGTGWDLTDCSSAAVSGGQAAVPDCVMMRRVVDRFATSPSQMCTTAGVNGATESHCFLTVDELQRSYNAWYDQWRGTQTLIGPGMSFRLGFELNF